MAHPHDIPPALCDGPFRSATAVREGLPRTALRGHRFRRLFRDVYVFRAAVLSFTAWLHAARLVLPDDAVVSHSSAVRLYGFEPRDRSTLEFSTNTNAITRHASIRLHRRQGRLTPYVIDELPVTGPDRTFVDAATCLTFTELVQFGDWLLHHGHTTLDRLLTYAIERHLHGVRRARRALRFVREGVESPRETSVRLQLVFARLPEPECNVDILDATGRFLARGDMVYRRWKVLVEYDGWHHERDARQRQRDIGRRERLELNGWTVVVVTIGDFAHPREIAWRVYTALKAKGYAGQRPVTSVIWTRWFEPRSF
jgi:hypothetical protein